MNIELIPHIGTTAGGLTVEFKQKFIRVDGITVGILGDEPGATVCITNRQATNDKMISEIVKFVEGERGAQPPIAMPPEVSPVETEDDEEYDE